jgi:serine phosphatase RsbU (regulator of sigma subunit)/anti-sigma regulatory factor (Ser/Thr protein kinase)
LAEDRGRGTGRTDEVRRAYDASPLPMATTEGPAHVYVACNAAYRRHTGASGLVGRAHADTVPGPAGERIARLLDRAWVSHEPTAADGLYAAPYRGTDGSVAGVHLTQVGETSGDQPDLVTAMQDALLPASLPVVPGLDLTARYLLAAEGSAGGDWFDVVVRPDGRVALVVGDVVGHGVAASAAMGQLRAVLRAQLLTDRPLQAAMRDVDRFARREAEMQATTLCVLLLDLSHGDVEYCTAGHPPPLVVGRAGVARYLEPSGAAPLATTGELACGRDRLDESDLVLLYTDGVVERPERTVAEGTVELSEAARWVTSGAPLRPHDPPRPVERVCDAGVELLTSTTGYADDVTLLAAQRRVPTPALSTSVEATLSGATAARDAVSEWLAPLDISAVDELAVRHAVCELVTNAVLHAHAGELRSDRRRVEVDAEVNRDGVLSCRVHDDGGWKIPGRAEGSWGLAMVAAMVDDLRFDRGSGTTATFRMRLTRTARMMAGRHHWGVRPRGRDFGLRHEGSHIWARGDVDAAGAELLRTALMRAWRGVENVLVDLSGVTMLSSSAVRVLHEACGSGRGTTLHAPMGSAAQHVLDLVRLPYEAGALA